jgi:hypothetical protein
VSWIHKKSLTFSIQRLGDALHDNQRIAAISQVPYGLWHRPAAFNVTHFELAILLVWVVGGVADNGGWVSCGLGFSEQWNIDPCSSAYFVWDSSWQCSNALIVIEDISKTLY